MKARLQHVSDGIYLSEVWGGEWETRKHGQENITDSISSQKARRVGIIEKDKVRIV